MADDPLIMLTKRFAEPQNLPEDLTQLGTKEQLQMYMAFDTGATYFGLRALGELTTQDKMIMMAVQGKRAEQIVDSVRGISNPLGIDAGLQDMQRYSDRVKARRLRSRGGDNGQD